MNRLGRGVAPASEGSEARRGPETVGRNQAGARLAGATATGAGVLVGRLVLDLSARQADISARPTRLAFDLGLVALPLLAIAIVAHHRQGGRSSDPVRWLAALAALTAVVTSLIRLRIGAAATSGPATLPLEVLGAGAALAAAALAARGRAPTLVLRRAADVTLAAALVALVVRTAIHDPMPWLRVASTEERILAVTASVAAVATAGWASSGPLARRPATLVAALTVLAAAWSWSGGWTTGAWVVVAVVVVALRGGAPERAAALARAARSRTARTSPVPARRDPRRPVQAGRGRSWPRSARAGRRRAAAPTARPDPPGPHRLQGADRWWAVGLAALATATVAADLVWALRAGAQPVGHGATVAARAWDVGGEHTPVLGMPTGLGDPSRDISAHHPGPLLFYVLAPFEHLLGLRAGAFVGSAAVSLGGWLLAVWAAFRAGGRAAALGAALAASVVANIVIRDLTFEPLNVFSVTMVLLAVPLLCWAATTGTPRALVWAVVGASLNVQAYLPHGLVAVVPVVWAAALVAMAAAHATGPRGRDARRALVWSTVALVACWSVPLGEATLNRGGNVRALWQGWAADRASVGAAGFPQAVAWVWQVPVAWGRLHRIFVPEPAGYLGDLSPTGPVLVAALLAILVWQRRHLGPDLRRLGAVTALVLLAAGASVARLPLMPTAFYEVTWLAMVSVLGWFALGLGGWRVAATTQLGRSVATRARVGVALVAVIGMAAMGAVPSTLDSLRQGYAVVDRSAPSVGAAVLDATESDGEVLVVSDGLVPQNLADALTARLVSEDREVRVISPNDAYYGAGRAVGPGWSGVAIVVIDGAAGARPPGERLARVTPEGWTPARFAAAARRLKRWAAGPGRVEVEPEAVTSVRSSLRLWAGSDCETLEGLPADGFGAEALSPDALAHLYVEGVLDLRGVPDDLAAAVEGTLRFTPTEVWRVLTDRPVGSREEVLTTVAGACP